MVRKTRASKTKSLVHRKKLGKQEHGECVAVVLQEQQDNARPQGTELPNSDCQRRVDLQTLLCGGHLFLQLQGDTLAEAWFFSNTLVPSLAQLERSHRTNMMIERNSGAADTEGAGRAATSSPRGARGGTGPTHLGQTATRLLHE